MADRKIVIERLIASINFAFGCVARPTIKKGLFRPVPMEGSPSKILVSKEIQSPSAFARALGYRTSGKLSDRAVRGTRLIGLMLAGETRATCGRYTYVLLALKNDCERRLHYLKAHPARQSRGVVERQASA